MYGVVNTIVKNPILHRAKDRLFREEYYKKTGRDDFMFDTLLDTGIGDDDWICDFCNVSMEVGTKDNPQSILIHGSYALCSTCVKEYKTKYPEEFINQQDCKCCIEEEE